MRCQLGFLTHIYHSSNVGTLINNPFTKRDGELGLFFNQYLDSSWFCVWNSDKTTSYTNLIQRLGVELCIFTYIYPCSNVGTQTGWLLHTEDYCLGILSLDGSDRCSIAGLSLVKKKERRNLFHMKTLYMKIKQ